MIHELRRAMAKGELEARIKDRQDSNLAEKISEQLRQEFNEDIVTIIRLLTEIRDRLGKDK